MKLFLTMVVTAIVGYAYMHILGASKIPETADALVAVAMMSVIVASVALMITRSSAWVILYMAILLIIVIDLNNKVNAVTGGLQW